LDWPSLVWGASDARTERSENERPHRDVRFADRLCLGWAYGLDRLVKRVFTNARVIDPDARVEWFGSVLIEGSRIAGLGDAPSPSDAHVTDCQGKVLAPGIVDLGTQLFDPSAAPEHAFEATKMAAARGGVTTLVAFDRSSRAIDTPEALTLFLQSATQPSGVRVLPLAALTCAHAGQDLAELALLQEGGAVAFGDLEITHPNAKHMAHAMQYAADLGALVVADTQEPSFTEEGIATASKFASLRALPAVPTIAERMALERDLALVDLTGVRYHAAQITTAGALSALAAAKARGLTITAGTSIHHLSFNDFDLGDYQTAFKIRPPLRSEEDRQALIQGLADGVIDVVTAGHRPVTNADKDQPFEHATPGGTGLETLLSGALRIVNVGHMSLAELWAALSRNPARRLGLEQGQMAVGAPADLVLFDPDVPYVFKPDPHSQASTVSPFAGQRLEGKVIETVVDGTTVYRAH